MKSCNMAAYSIAKARGLRGKFSVNAAVVVQLDNDASRVARVNQSRARQAMFDIEPRFADEQPRRAGRELDVHAGVDNSAAAGWDNGIDRRV